MRDAQVRVEQLDGTTVQLHDVQAADGAMGSLAAAHGAAPSIPSGHQPAEEDTGHQNVAATDHHRCDAGQRYDLVCDDAALASQLYAMAPSGKGLVPRCVGRHISLLPALPAAEAGATPQGTPLLDRSAKKKKKRHRESEEAAEPPTPQFPAPESVSKEGKKKRKDKGEAKDEPKSASKAVKEKKRKHKDKDKEKSEPTPKSSSKKEKEKKKKEKKDK